MIIIVEKYMPLLKKHSLSIYRANFSIISIKSRVCGHVQTHSLSLFLMANRYPKYNLLLSSKLLAILSNVASFQSSRNLELSEKKIIFSEIS
jgi:hypothetical protein